MEKGQVMVLKHRGMFFRAEESDAVVLCNIMGYQLNREKSGKLFCGFPQKSLDKVADKLIEEHVSFLAVWPTKEDPERIVIEYEAPENRYDEYGEIGNLEINDIGEKKKRKEAKLKKILEEEPEYEFLKWLCNTAEQDGINCRINLSNHNIRKKLFQLKAWVDEKLLKTPKTNEEEDEA